MADAAGAQATTETPEALQDAAFAATEAWQAKPDDEGLKTAAKDAVGKAKTATETARKSAAEAKTKADAEAATRKAPDKYELKAPEGSLIDAAGVERIAALAKAQGLSATQAQALLEHESQAASAAKDGQTTQLEEMSGRLLETAKADKEIGGEGFAKNAEKAKRVVDKYGSQELKTALNDSGLGNHPELIRLLVRVYNSGKMGEDSFVSGSSVGGDTQSAAEKMYPSTKEN
jgi:hypothetical protein